jgi:hypothetical protein
MMCLTKSFHWEDMHDFCIVYPPHNYRIELYEAIRVEFAFRQCVKIIKYAQTKIGKRMSTEKVCNDVCLIGDFINHFREIT